MIKRKKTWAEEQLRDAVATSFSLRQVLKKIGLKEAGGNYEQVKRCIKELKIPDNHFRGRAWNKGMVGIGKPIYSIEKLLVKDSHYQSYMLKLRLFGLKLKKPICELCGWSQKSLDGRLPLELDHLNGDRHDNRLENLRILCPNCHSLQPTHRGKNRSKETKKLFI